MNVFWQINYNFVQNTFNYRGPTTTAAAATVTTTTIPTTTTFQHTHTNLIVYPWFLKITSNELDLSW